jgi:hypothetical protein
MHIDLDHGVVAAESPDHVMSIHEGMVIEMAD